MIKINPVYIDKFKKISQGYSYYDESIKGSILYFNKNQEYTSYATYFDYLYIETRVYRCIERLLKLGYLEIVEEW